MPDLGSFDTTDAILKSSFDQGLQKLSDAVKQKQDMTASSFYDDITSGDAAESTAKVEKRSKGLEKRVAETKKLATTPKGISAVEKAEKQRDSATQYQQKNPELKSDKLLKILKKVAQLKESKRANPKSIMEAIKAEFDEPSLIDEAMNFLLDNTDPKEDVELNKTIADTQDTYQKEHSREIKASKNIAEVANKYATKETDAKDLRSLYQDITGNPRETKDLFKELSEKYPDMKSLNRVLKFLFKALGEDLNSGGPSIEAGKLKNLMEESKTLQAINGIHRCFQEMMPHIQKMFVKLGMPVPEKLNFQNLAKQFIALLSDRYPTSDKVLSMADKMGLSSIVEKIIYTESNRDAVRAISPRAYNSTEHRVEVSKAIIEALEKLYQDEEAEEDAGAVADARSHMSSFDKPIGEPTKENVVQQFYKKAG